MAHAASGVSEDELTARIAAVMPKGTEVLTGTEITEENQNLMHQGLGFLTTFLLVFAAIGLVVACFTIYNTFQIIVTQRSREMALLRSVGATRRQVLWAQLIEALILGVLASIIGLVVGVLVAGGLKAMMTAFGIDIPAGGTVFSARTAIVAMAVGTIVTIASAVFPSMRASRVPPIAAIREIAADAAVSRARPRLVQGGVITVLGIVAFVAGLAGSGILLVGIGALLVFLGVFTLGPLIARPVTRVLGAPVARAGGVAGVIARENAGRNPKRTARTGGALMVGVALVVAITVIAATARDWTHDVFGSQFTGDFVVSTKAAGFGGISPDLATSLNTLPEVAAAAGVRQGAATEMGEGGGDTSYVAVDPDTASKVFDIGMIEGDFAALSPEGILVNESKARDRNLAMGDTVDFGFIDGTTRTLTVEGIYTKDDLAGPYVVSQALHEQTGADQFDFSIFIVKAPGVGDAEVRAAISTFSQHYPNAKLQSRSEYIDTQAAQIDQIVNLMYGLLVLAIIVALISIANSISLSIHERIHELGLLRAVGMTRHQTGSAVRWEAAIVSSLGTALGAFLGLCFGWALSVSLRKQGLTNFEIPVTSLLVICAIGVLGGVLAALRPGWRAARLDVLRSIATE
jgi:putative ABC transport system permease protein